jgi:hypothetical protein
MPFSFYFGAKWSALIGHERLVMVRTAHPDRATVTADRGFVAAFRILPGFKIAQFELRLRGLSYRCFFHFRFFHLFVCEGETPLFTPQGRKRGEKGTKKMKDAAMLSSLKVFNANGGVPSDSN